MDNGPPSLTTFADEAGISVSYASEIVRGKRRPSRPLAISIYRRTGRKFGPIVGLPDVDIDTLERLESAAA